MSERLSDLAKGKPKPDRTLLLIGLLFAVGMTAALGIVAIVYLKPGREKVAASVPTVGDFGPLVRPVDPDPVPTPAAQPAPAPATRPQPAATKPREALRLSDPEVAKRFRLMDGSAQDAARRIAKQLDDVRGSHLKDGDWELFINRPDFIDLFDSEKSADYLVYLADQKGADEFLKVMPHPAANVRRVKVILGFLSPHQIRELRYIAEEINRDGAEEMLRKNRDDQLRMALIRNNAYVLKLTD